jgi:hypothetical protein
MIGNPILLSTALLLLPSVAAAQETDESCRAVMDATTARIDHVDEIGSGTSHNRRVGRLLALEQREPLTDAAFGPSEGDAGYIRSYVFDGETLGDVAYTRFRCSGDTLFVESTGLDTPDVATDWRFNYRPPLPLMVVGAAEGHSWDWNGTMVYSGGDTPRTYPAQQTATMLAAELIETPAGQFECQHVQLQLTVIQDTASRVITRDLWFTTDPVYMVLQSRTQGGPDEEIWTLRSITEHEGN